MKRRSLNRPLLGGFSKLTSTPAARGFQPENPLTSIFPQTAGVSGGLLFSFHLVFFTS